MFHLALLYVLFIALSLNGYGARTSDNGPSLGGIVSASAGMNWKCFMR